MNESARVRHAYVPDRTNCPVCGAALSSYEITGYDADLHQHWIIDGWECSADREHYQEPVAFGGS